MLKKLLTSIIILTTLLVSLFSPFVDTVKAEGEWWKPSFQDWYSKVNSGGSEEIFGERYTAAQVRWVVYGLVAILIEPADIGGFLSCMMDTTKNPVECASLLPEVTSNLPAQNKERAQQNPLQFLTEDRPLSAITYFKNLARKFHIVPEAQAQAGFGFRALDPVLSLWRGVRNITYLLFIFITIALAFMIMFRVKISPQTAVTVQSAIPKVAITLILVTFSYAIAGFMVDLMYVVTGILGIVMSSTFPGAAAGVNINNFYDLIRGPFGGGIIGWSAVYLGGFMLGLALTLLAPGGLAQTAITAIPFLPLVAVITFFVFLVMIVLLFIGVIRILWVLIKAFANVLILTVFAPIQISVGAIVPNAGFGPWLKSLMGHLMVFPTTGFLFYLATLFCTQAIGIIINGLFSDSAAALDIIKNFVISLFSGASSSFPIAELLNISLSGSFSEGWPPLLGVGRGGAALAFLGASIAIVFIIPKVNEVIQAFIEGKPFAYGTAIGQALGPVVEAGKIAGLYGAGKVIEVGEGGEFGAGAPPPMWTQAARRILGLKK
ncbi:hypothetical protein A2210_00010 [Candidatus Woesebacteria bacterium RIFOXYA1_FULL_40_18]|uniref:Uncharacterized protein n=2 Tax=Candidatus Woeseibacteriota TaxID=1752722 RepID=A0A1F8CM00_9BACT|nr:MAG: hypothetical protein A2210_00010 [Candidatus Woesebacteria bacterium RIFOXYA1_FULL_40_18]